jgi:leucyl-tRNA synthetase
MERFNFQVIEKKWQEKFTQKKLYNKNGKIIPLVMLLRDLNF